jgi:hypothetical protein
MIKYFLNIRIYIISQTNNFVNASLCRLHKYQLRGFTMNSLPCQGCRGLCCGPVPVTEQELKGLKKKIKAMPSHHRKALESQHRYFGTCIFYDLDNDKCGVHSARPSVCRAFGLHANLVCFRNPDAATASSWVAEHNPVGVLSVDYTWKDFN